MWQMHSAVHSPEKKRKRSRRRRGSKQPRKNRALYSKQGPEFMKTTESLRSDFVAFPLVHFEDFYLYNLKSPQFTANTSSTDTESRNRDLLLSGYLRDIQCVLADFIPKEIVSKIMHFHQIDDGVVSSGDNEFCSTDSGSWITDNELDIELGISPPLNVLNLDRSIGSCGEHQDLKIADEYSLTLSSRSPSYTPSDSDSSGISGTYQRHAQIVLMDTKVYDISNQCSMYTQHPLTQQNLPNYESMDIGTILSWQLGIHELIKFNLVHRMMSDQHGSRYLQNIINSLHCTRRTYIISMLINHLIGEGVDLTHMSEDMYGNYLIQLFFIHGNNGHHEFLLKNWLYCSTLRLCQSKYGCRVIQKILSSVRTEHQLKLIECFKRQTTEASAKPNDLMHECLLCCNANHVIQAIIELKLPYTHLEFIKEALEKDLVVYSENVYACRVVQAFVKVYGDKLDVSKLCLNDNHLFLCRVKYGNYVIQCIVQKGQWYSNLANINKFRNELIADVCSAGNLLYLSKDKFGSNVIETCVRVSNEHQIDRLVNTICAKQGYLLRELISDKFGNYIPKTLLEHCRTRKQQIKIVHSVHKYVANLYQYYHGYKHCAAFMKQCQEIMYRIDGY